MGLRIRTNTTSLNAQRNLSLSTERLSSSMNRLASGKRINKAADDAAGLGVSENLRADIRSLNQARRNAMDGVSLVQTAEGGLMETANMLVRLRELAVYSASDTIGNTEREFLDQEFLQLKDEINRIATATEFNGTRLLTGESELPDEITEGIPNNLPLEIQVSKDYFPETDAIDQRNPANIIKINLENINAITHGEGSLELGDYQEGARVNTKESAQMSINSVDGAITKVNEYRAFLGAVQNRLGSTVRNLGVQTENLEAAKSRIVDTDFAMETAEMTKQTILQQAGTSVLSSANSQPQVALSLLGG